MDQRPGLIKREVIPRKALPQLVPDPKPDTEMVRRTLSIVFWSVGGVVKNAFGAVFEKAGKFAP